MHPWTNDLGWVISPLDNVFVGKMDSVENDTGPWAKYLQSQGIPNLFYLPGHKKKTPPAKKLEFGASNEDKEGPVPARIESMVRGIHKNMPNDGNKFDVKKYVRRGKLIVVCDSFPSPSPSSGPTIPPSDIHGAVPMFRIFSDLPVHTFAIVCELFAHQGLEGFLSEMSAADSTKTWLDYLRGDVVGGRGKYKEYSGLPARCKVTMEANKTSVVSIEWKSALKHAALYTESQEHAKLGTDCTAVELVIAKLMHQLWQEMKGGGLTVEEADDVVKSARKFAKEDMTVRTPPRISKVLPASHARPNRAGFWGDCVCFFAPPPG